jgi:SAM-dependent methyltransferase
MTTSDPFAQFKAAQREGWSNFAQLEPLTTIPAGTLVRFARVRRGEGVLDVACGTGVVAVTAARQGASVRGLDLTPALLERARENARIAGVEIDFVEGDVESLPYADASFDVVLSQYGHMFAPRPEQAVSEMLRVLKPGGRIAFSTWPPEMYTGRMFALVARRLQPPPGAAPPPLWGDPNVVRERLGAAVTDLVCERDLLLTPALSVQHFRALMERTAGPVTKLVATLDAEALAAFRAEWDAVIAEYFVDNAVRQHYLLTRATKR